ncbi:hypothetical protein PR048_028198 [Dryococelus australis]|uniref:Uncharacterized protein n=1 Tax=Dryococelus australis TaxID=614101 RepID=A0ABQ9GIK6_9NEOP|nr:hypothetical protein PR048_028198 [Dryococelus australis]
MTSQHTSKDLAAEVKRIVSDWDLDTKVILAASDNASNISAAIVKELGWKHFGCFAHAINLFVKDGLREKTATSVIYRIKTIVAHFRRSNTSHEKLMTCQRNSGETPLKLLQDVPTRWNSAFYMLERFTNLEYAIRSTIALLDKDFPVLTAGEWRIVIRLCHVLRPFEGVTKTVSGETYCTASLVIPLVNGMHSMCTNLMKEEFCEPVRNVVMTIQQRISSKLGNVELSNTLAVSTFLDPRFKRIAFSSKAYSDHAKKLVTSVLSKQFETSTEKRKEKAEVGSSLEGSGATNDLSIWGGI